MYLHAQITESFTTFSQFFSWSLHISITVWWKVRKRIVFWTIDLKLLYLNQRSNSKFHLNRGSLSCIIFHVLPRWSVSKDFVWHIYKNKDVPAQLLSSSENRRCLAVCIFKLFKKRWSTFYVEMGNRFPASHQQNFDEI
jgi:hypothetical protein